MPTTPREGKPSFWTTTIAKALSGDQPCQLSPWLSGHFNLEKRVRDDQGSLAVWKANHTTLLNALVAQMRSEGWKCSVERFFRVTGSRAIVAGKADCVAQQDGKRPVILDAKSGTPRDSDVMQVLVEMVLIPLAWNSPQMIFDGRVIYPDDTVSVTPAQAEAIRPKVFAMLKKLVEPERPTASPGIVSCRFCDVAAADCPDRIDVEPATEADTELF